MMKWTQAMDRIFTELADVFQRAGRGSIQRAEEELKVYRGFFRKARHRNRLDLPKLLQAFEILSIHPGEFFDSAFRQKKLPLDRPIKDFGLKAERIADDYPDIDSVLEWRRFQALGSLTEVQVQRCRALEQILFEQPEVVRTHARHYCFEAILVNNLSLLLRSAAIWSSALLYADHDEKAQAVLWRAMHLARSHAHQLALADLSLRATQLAIKQQNPQVGAVFAQEAAGIFSMVGQPIGVTRTLIAISNIQRSLGQKTEALMSLRAALRFITKEQPREHLLVHHGLSLEAFREHALERAAEHAAQARESLAAEPPRSGLHGYMTWLDARIASRDRSQQKDQVEFLYRQACAELAHRPRLRTRISLELESFLQVEESARTAPRPPQRVLPYAFDLEGERLSDLVISELVQYSLEPNRL